MAEHLIIQGADKQERYQTLLPQALALIESETDQIAALANLCAALHSSFDWLCTGFYLVKGQQLVLGPFQGPIACTRIPFGKGVCGSAWQAGKTLVVDDVDAFPGHIACSSSARSEIVLPCSMPPAKWRRCWTSIPASWPALTRWTRSIWSASRPRSPACSEQTLAHEKARRGALLLIQPNPLGPCVMPAMPGARPRAMAQRQLQPQNKARPDRTIRFLPLIIANRPDSAEPASAQHRPNHSSSASSVIHAGAR